MDAPGAGLNFARETSPPAKAQSPFLWLAAASGDIQRLGRGHESLLMRGDVRMDAVSMSLVVGCGAVVGLSLAFTGSGGTAFAVPLLVYALNLGPHQAVCVSMAAIGATTALAVVPKIRAGEIDVGAGLFLAGAGMLGAPFGAWIGLHIREGWLLVIFSAVVLLIGLRMAFGAPARANQDQPAAECEPPGKARKPGGRWFDLSGTRRMGLCVGGAITGLLAGLLGVGGGFILVPILVLFGRVEMHRAVATSLAVIALVSLPATTSHLLAGQTIPLDIAVPFAGGSLLGLTVGSRVARHLSGLKLQRVFGVAMLLTAAFILLHSLRDLHLPNSPHPTALAQAPWQKIFD